MKKTAILSTLSFIPLVLTSCVNGISKEEYSSKLAEVESNYVNLDNIHINNKASVDRYDYKEGEFYSYYMFALILIVPVTQGTYTWKENDKYYHAETHTDSKKNKKTEITKEQFDTYMLGHKAKMISMMEDVTGKIKNLMQDKPEGGITATNEYKYDGFNSEYHFYSKAKVPTGTEYNPETDQMEYTNYQDVDYFVSFKDQKLKEYHSKTTDTSTSETNTSDSYLYFSFGNAEFKEPNINSEA